MLRLIELRVSPSLSDLPAPSVPVPLRACAPWLHALQPNLAFSV